LPVLKRFTTLFRFDGADFRGVDSVLNGLEMALYEIVAVLYVIDNQYYILNEKLGL
jgi:hypothetical protein